MKIDYLAGDSRLPLHCITGGITGGDPAEAIPAFSHYGIFPSPIPVVIAVPHSGRDYSQALLENMRHPASAPLRLEDRYVDLLGIEVAQRTGANLLVAHAPRAMIDLNRSVDDIDWDMIQATPNDAVSDATGEGQYRLAPRARSGLGLIPRRLPGTGEIWKCRIDRAELDRRIAGVHVPYHNALAASLDAVRARWGAALLIDLHSMPPLSTRSAGEPAAEFVIGDRFGASCDGALAATILGYFAESRRLAAHNRPYAGAYVLDRHARRGAGANGGVHCLQIEIDRRAYLDAQMSEPGAGFEKTVELLTGMVQRIASAVAGMGQFQHRWSAAAE